jgi:hypothetical protein
MAALTQPKTTRQATKLLSEVLQPTAEVPRHFRFSFEASMRTAATDLILIKKKIAMQSNEPIRRDREAGAAMTISKGLHARTACETRVPRP